MASDTKNTKTISILGCGWLGLPLARLLVKRGFIVKGATTTDQKLELMSSEGIIPYLIKLDPSLEGEPKDFFDSDILVINIPPRSRTKESSYHVEQIKNVLKNIPKRVKTVVYVSSTSIYPKAEGDYSEELEVTEETTGNVAIFNSERLIMDLTDIDRKYILRSAGQMGLERIPGKYYAGKKVKGANDYINYIHQDDLVGLVAYAICEQPEEGKYNIVAARHPLKRDVVDKSIEKMGFEKAIYGDDFPGTNRTISGDKVALNWKYKFKYPDPMDFEYQI